MAIDDILTPRDLNGGNIPATSVLAMGDEADALRALVDSRWDVVFFCAEEIPPPPQAFKDGARRVRVFHVPLRDAEIGKEECFRAAQGGNMAARFFLLGKRVLVTCAMGKNRSGLVSALAVDAITGEGGKTAIGLVRAKRKSLLVPPALENPSFLIFLSQFDPRNVAAKVRVGATGARG